MLALNCFNGWLIYLAGRLRCDSSDLYSFYCIEVRYHLDEDPKTLKVFPIPLHDSSGVVLPYDRLSISPDGRIVAATHGTTLQWLSVESGVVLDTAEKAHDSKLKQKFFN